ncbi:hypothetical protein [Anaerocolumna aminovalerica]|uniref:hypothetical protein n=1 Tax=Anaerocolumna aminovalerica TaxID=1527 RepID=UPI000BE3CCA6|nr:hypothetical protein [Anaerocolumna aminovalerica]
MESNYSNTDKGNDANKKEPRTEFVSFNDSNYVNINNASKFGVKNKRKYVSGDISRSSANHRFTPLGEEDKNDNP